MSNGYTVSDEKNAVFEKSSSITSLSNNEHEAEKQEPHFRATLDPVDEVDAVVDPFASQLENNNDAVNFRNMGWISAGLLITCEQVALGILSFPSNYHQLGMFGGVFSTFCIGMLCWITGIWLVEFKKKFPGCLNYGDAGRIMFGRVGGIIFGYGLVLKSIFMAASHVLSGGIAFRKMIDNNALVCSIVWTVVMAVVSFLMSLSRRMEKLTALSIASVTAILTASFITVIATGVQDNTRLIPEGGEPVKWYAFENHGLIGTISALTDIIFGWGGQAIVLTVVSEMKRPDDFKKSLGIVQVLSITFYTIVGATIYSFGGQYVTSPSLTMTARPVMITAYAIALISIFVAGVVPVAAGAKLVYVQAFRHSKRLTEKSWRMRFAWMGIVGSFWILGWVIANLIPFFSESTDIHYSEMLSIISSIFSVWFALGLPGICILHLYRINNASWREVFTWKRIPVIALAVLCICFSAVITPLGIYSAAEKIKEGYSSGEFGGPFTCAS
ncbi:hypothetical protein E3Q22_04349 [Wallemia mellicola]|uniref:Amino acid transporter transmembrane domain-containing protein n=1 Tax=Wallemia mellicola TaxID=1708541 RepID=A0A4T0TZZ4_9BASI|nr:hypothetical protein E3Q22_04349 [Wallemia mellicola]TIB85172.1 hypothetical protein E3Q19_04277 [Wallemia mellicola]TIB95224.1 hypothetical protein E3Q17_04346 [Wallemia mellicola]TIB95398.1 hypothetical protein E3Q18_03779 [Wallemia mellicola]TIC10800.1 hypothetical protein E3Q14_02619 [Wallemia mellicola]